jgi:hypothetical protein
MNGRRTRAGNTIAPAVEHGQPTPSAERAALAVLAERPHAYRFLRFRNVAINVWLGQPTAEAVAQLARLTDESARRNPRERISSIHLLDPRVGLPTADARSALTQLATRHRDHLACVGVVLSGDGFWASALRSALTGVILLVPSALPTRYVANVAELAEWLPEEHQKHSGVAVDRAELLACLHEARG